MGSWEFCTLHVTLPMKGLGPSTPSCASLPAQAPIQWRFPAGAVSVTPPPTFLNLFFPSRLERELGRSSRAARRLLFFTQCHEPIVGRGSLQHRES
jgi:hypothetical protein